MIKLTICLISGATVRLTGEGNSNPLQYSCLENPVDRATWWDAVHRVAQSWKQLKRLSMHACTGKGNSNPLQGSCLENPRDREAWWVAVYGVAQSWTRMRRLSISSSSSKASLVAQAVKNLPAMQETWVGKIPWRREWLPTLVFLPGEFHVQKGASWATVHGVTKSQTRLTD